MHQRVVEALRPRLESWAATRSASPTSSPSLREIEPPARLQDLYPHRIGDRSTAIYANLGPRIDSRDVERSADELPRL